GIGANAPRIRAAISEGLEWMGLELDEAANARAVDGRSERITREGARLAAWAIPTAEELLIARDTFRLVSGALTRR
ncbi:MAG TPA: hypothetical protein VLA43_00390, partial [Longimicrobiales bacterium]|nr:hypothetical protein [Longimicrobiales bacterium]